MKPEKFPRAIAARMVATKSLEGFAAKALAPDTVLAGVTRAAADGFYVYRMDFERPLDLQATEAAKKLAEVLEREGFKMEWKGRLVFGRENVTGADVITFDLIVRW